MNFNSRGFHLQRQGAIHEETKHKFIVFKKEDTVIGRDETADIQITDIEKLESISRKHLRVLFRNDNIFIEAFPGKTALINGVKLVNRQKLKVGNVIAFGKSSSGSNQPAISFKVEGCIEIDSSDDDSNPSEDSMTEAIDQVLKIEDETVERLAARLEALPEIFLMEDIVISDDEECENARNSDIVQTSTITKLTKESSQDFYPTYSLQNLPPIRSLEVRLTPVTKEDVDRYTRERTSSLSGSENVAPKKRKPRNVKVKKSTPRTTAYDRVQALVDSDSESEEDSDSGSFRSASSDNKARQPQSVPLSQSKRWSDRKDPNNNSNNVNSKQKSLNSGTPKNSVESSIPTRDYKKQAHENARKVPQKREVAAPKRVKRSLGFSSDDSRESIGNSLVQTPELPKVRPHKLANEFSKQRSAIMIEQAGSASIRKRRMSVVDQCPTATSPFKKSRPMAQVSGHRTSEPAGDVFSKAQELRAERNQKHKDELLRAAKHPLPDTNKIEYRPMINSGPKRRVSMYKQQFLQKASTSTASTSKSTEAPSKGSLVQRALATDKTVNEKLCHSAKNQNSHKKPENPNNVELPKAKYEGTKNSHTAVILPPVSSLGRIPRISDRKTSELDAVKHSENFRRIQSTIKTFSAKYVDPYKVVTNASSSKQEPAKEIPPAAPATMGFYKAIEYSPPAGRNAVIPDTSTPVTTCTTSPVVPFTPDTTVTSILKNGEKKNTKAKTLRFSANLFEQKTYELDEDDWDYVPPAHKRD